VSADLIETAATALGPLLNEVVFLGGASIHLWLSDPVAPDARATEDVDVISDITSLTSYYQLGERLRARGFSEASDSRVICRWRHSETGLILDVMPHDETYLEDFTNFWRGEQDPAAKRQLLSRIFERVWLDEQKLVAVRPKASFVPYFQHPSLETAAKGVCKERERRPHSRVRSTNSANVGQASAARLAWVSTSPVTGRPSRIG
jgi:hypothetical protein